MAGASEVGLAFVGVFVADLVGAFAFVDEDFVDLGAVLDFVGVFVGDFVAVFDGVWLWSSACAP